MIVPSAVLKFSLFHGLTEEQAENIIPLMVQEEYNPDEIIITEGKSNDKIYFIVKGKVTATKRNTLLSYFCEGDSFGEMEVLDVMPANATIKAFSPVVVMAISNKALRTIYNIDVKTFSLLILNIARDFSRRLRKMDEKLASSPPIFI